MAKTVQVEKYTKAGRILHHTHTAAFILLFLTGLILYIPGLGVIAQGGWTRIIHRIAALIFIVAPVIHLILRPRVSIQWLKEAFSWGSADLGWVKAAPRYYFLGDEKGMPPQDHINTGQKLWWFIVVVFSALFILTGIIMLLKTAVPSGLLQAMVIIHDISFIVTGAMLFVHIYLGVFHPMMKESWNAIWKGTVSSEYAKSHHGKWYEKIARKG
jgi:formate dehydrogenase subunit gamma